MTYWNDKDQLAANAREHTKQMRERFRDEIVFSCINSKIYNDGFTPSLQTVKETLISVEDLDTVSAIFKYGDESKECAVLNFASYNNPGGKFLEGSSAQEECLCHASFLYNVLSEEKAYYQWNQQHKNRALYTNRALYSPKVIFEQGNTIRGIDVITCAAPNKGAAQRYMMASDSECAKVLDSRIKFVLDVAEDNAIDILILGAFGCGVFKQNAYEVASIFKHYLSTTHHCFEHVIFAVPKQGSYNLNYFKLAFKEDA